MPTPDLLLLLDMTVRLLEEPGADPTMTLAATALRGMLAELKEKEQIITALKMVLWFSLMAHGGTLEIADHAMLAHDPSKALINKEVDERRGTVIFTATAIMDKTVEA